jgi:predicted DNA-binding protein (MmcQ/YjbR family)
MDIVELREYCLSLPCATEDTPFDEVTLVFRVGGKLFALTDLEGPLWVNLKCDPELAIQLREEHPSVTPGYHMSKKHWNTIQIDGSVSDKTIKEWIDHSYQLVRQSLSRKVKAELDSQE